MDIAVTLKNPNMTEQDVINLSSRDLDGKEVSVPIQGDQKKAIQDRLEQLVTDIGRKSSFKSALAKWQEAVPAVPPGKHTLKVTVEYKGGLKALGGHIVAEFYSVPTKPNPAQMVDHGMVNDVAATEIRGLTPAMISALKMVFNKTATGRSAPGTSNVNHIHVGGNAQENLLFYMPPNGGPYVVLGVVDGHIDKAAQPSIRAKAQTLTARATGPATSRRIQGSMLV